jgi:hypothetical protein
MSLVTVANDNTAQANDINQIINVLQQPSGGQETGKYRIEGWGSANLDAIAVHVFSLSRVSTPVSVSIDTADQSPTGMSTPGASHQNSSGFHISCGATGATTDAFAGGNFTIQY